MYLDFEIPKFSLVHSPTIHVQLRNAKRIYLIIEMLEDASTTWP